MVAVGGGGLFSGVATVARAHGLRVVAAEPEGCCCLHQALAAGQPVDVEVDSVAADSLGARRASQMAVDIAQADDCTSVLVADAEIERARAHLWGEYRLAVEHAAATAFAAGCGTGAYQPQPGEKVGVILCGANTDPGSLTGNASW